jgi:hypothetical protein
MNSLKTLARRLCLWAMVWGWWFTIEGTAWAKKAVETSSTEKAGKPSYWVFPYFIVILCIALGMLVVCRTARRSERAKPQTYEELKTAD